MYQGKDERRTTKVNATFIPMLKTQKRTKTYTQLIHTKLSKSEIEEQKNKARITIIIFFLIIKDKRKALKCCQKQRNKL